MPAFLSEAWIDALADRLAARSVDPALEVAVRQVVDDVSWTVRVTAGRVRLDRDPAADVTLTTDRATAEALVAGELAAQDALAAGRLRIGGDLTKLLGASQVIAGLGWGSPDA